MSSWGYCQGGPLFCQWGAIRFTGSRGKWIVARESDGAVVSYFHMGRGEIWKFNTPLEALITAKGEKKLKGKPCLIRLLNINYSTYAEGKKKRLHSLVYKGKMKGIKCFDYMPDKPGTYRALANFDWPKFDWKGEEERQRRIHQKDRERYNKWIQECMKKGK